MWWILNVSRPKQCAAVQKKTDRFNKTARGFHLVYFRSPHGVVTSTISQSIGTNRRTNVSTRGNLYQHRDSAAAGSGLRKFAHARTSIVHRAWPFASAWLR